MAKKKSNKLKKPTKTKNSAKLSKMTDFTQGKKFEKLQQSPKVKNSSSMTKNIPKKNQKTGKKKTSTKAKSIK